jgi:hypothetical protein
MRMAGPKPSTQRKRRKEMKRYSKRYGQYENLSLLMSAVYRLNEVSQQCHDDIDAFYAPSECHGVQVSADKAAFVRILVAAELTPDELYEEVKNRTTSKFAHFFLSPAWDFDAADLYQNVEIAAGESSNPIRFAFKAGRIMQRMIEETQKQAAELRSQFKVVNLND